MIHVMKDIKNSQGADTENGNEKKGRESVQGKPELEGMQPGHGVGGRY
jgi:hypothetical protein